MPKKAIKNTTHQTGPASADSVKEDIFREVRTLPVDLPVIDFFSWCNQNQIIGGRDELRKAIEDWKGQIRKDFPEFAEYCENAFAADTTTAIRKVEEAQQIHRFAYLLAEYAEQYRQKLEQGTPYYYWRDLPLQTILRIGEPDGSKNGVIRIEPPRYAAAFEGADITKVRTCKNCHKVFWQGRKDKLHCSKSCGNATQVKKLRSDPTYRAQVNASRKLSYQNKKRKGKQNGDL